MIAAVAVIGGGSWLLGMVIGVILGAVATLTVVGRSDEVRPAARPAPAGRVDPVTGLPTHDKLVADLQDAVDAGDDRVLTLYLFALDGFKDYNDAYGDACGDALLEWLARKLRDAVGSYGSVYRMRGGSFALLAVGSERFTSALCASAASALGENGDGFQIYCDVGQAALPARGALAAGGARARRPSRQPSTASERHVKSGRRAPVDTIEALRLVRSRRDVATLATGIARRLGVPEADIETRRDGDAPVRHRQRRGAARRARVPGQDQRARVAVHPPAHARGRAAPRGPARDGARRPARAPQPRALGRVGISRTASPARRSRSGRASCSSAARSTT